MIGYVEFKEALDILIKARCNLDYQDYVNMWGKELATHIWRQEGSDLLRIWRSGLRKEQADKFVTYVLDNSQDEK